MRDRESADDCRDNYVRGMSGPIPLVGGEQEREGRTGDVGLIYFDISRAVDTGLDILEVAGSSGEDEYRDAKADCTIGLIHPNVVAGTPSNDFPAVSAVTNRPEYRGLGYDTQLVRLVVAQQSRGHRETC